MTLKFNLMTKYQQVIKPNAFCGNINCKKLGELFLRKSSWALNASSAKML